MTNTKTITTQETNLRVIGKALRVWRYAMRVSRVALVVADRNGDGHQEPHAGYLRVLGRKDGGLLLGGQTKIDQGGATSLAPNRKERR